MPSPVTATTSPISLKYLTTVLKYQRESLNFLYGAIASPAAIAPRSFKHLTIVNLSWDIHWSQLFFYSAINSPAATTPISFTHLTIVNLSWRLIVSPFVSVRIYRSLFIWIVSFDIFIGLLGLVSFFDVSFDSVEPDDCIAPAPAPPHGNSLFHRTLSTF